LSAVTLPRPLVLKLLHLAQQGPGSGFISRHADGSFKIGAVDDAPFAFYRIGSQAVFETGDIERCRGLTSLMLSVSVGTKGVLELQAWRIAGEGAEPVEVILAEEARVPV
jgi:hypothetical protein